MPTSLTLAASSNYRTQLLAARKAVKASVKAATKIKDKTP